MRPHCTVENYICTWTKEVEWQPKGGSYGETELLSELKEQLSNGIFQKWNESQGSNHVGNVLCVDFKSQR